MIDDRRSRQRGFLIDPYRAKGSSGLLDAYLTGIFGLYSCIYRLSGAYAGPLFKVRNGTTSVETDIYPVTGTGVIDTTALSTAAGGASLFVKTLYDQTGNGRDFTQGTSAAQSRIVNAGTFDKAMVFDATDDFMLGATMTGIAKELTLLLTYDFTAIATTSDTWIFLEPNSNYTIDSGMVWVNGGDVAGTGSGVNGFRLLTSNNGGSQHADIYQAVGSVHAMAAIFDRAQTVNTNQIKLVSSAGLLVSGSGPNVTSPLPSNNFGTSALYLGARGGASNFAPLKLQNLAIYLAAKTVSDMTAACALLPLYT